MMAMTRSDFPWVDVHAWIPSLFLLIYAILNIEKRDRISDFL